MLLPLPKLLAVSHEPDLLPKRIAITIPFVFGKIAHLLRVRSAKLASARCNCVLHFGEWQQEVLFVDRATHGEPFRPDHTGILVLVV